MASKPGKAGAPAPDADAKPQGRTGFQPGDYAVDRKPRLGPLLARRTLRPIARSEYDHECRATRPGLLPWLLALALLGLAVWSLLAASHHLEAPKGWGFLESRTSCVLLVAAALLALFWVAGWEARAAPRGILLGLGNRNVCSLSIAQAVAWTALFVAVTAASVLVVAVPQAVDSLGTVQAGIGVGAAAGSVLALSGKSGDDKTPDPERAVQGAAAMAVRREPKAYVRDLVSAAAAPGASKVGVAGAAAAARRRAGEGAGELTPDAAKDSVIEVAGLVRAASKSLSDPDRVAVKVLSRVARGDSPEEALKLLRLDPAKDAQTLEDLRALLANVPADLHSYVAGNLQEDTMRRGVLYCNGCPCEARLRDMLQGDEVGNTYQLDVNKLQFLALSLLAMAVYVAVATQRLAQPFGLAEYPGGVLATLGLSSAAYVGVKLPVQTPTVEG